MLVRPKPWIAFAVVALMSCGGAVEPTSTVDGGASLDASPEAAIDSARPDGRDVTAPTFRGCDAILEKDLHTFAVAWSEAVDDLTPQSEIAYDLFVGTTPGGEDFTRPAATFTGVRNGEVVAYGAKCGRGPVYVVCRARDGAGNSDSNTLEVRSSGPDGDHPPCFGGLDGAVEVTSSSVLLQWSAAVDERTERASITYSIYSGPSAGTVSFKSPRAVATPGATSYRLTDLPSLTDICFVVRAKDAGGSEENNTVERCIRTL